MQQTCLITGASTGIGYEFVKIFAAKNYNLVLVARNEEKLKQIAQELKEHHQIKVKIIVEDLSLPNAADAVLAELEKDNIHIDILVNNAGIGLQGFFAETSLKKELDMIQLNIVALTQLTKLFLPAMIKNKYGKILNVASVAGFFPGPCMSVYFASKAYVLSFSQAINNELEGTGVSCTALCPGGTKTDFFKSGEMENSQLAQNMKMADPATVAQEGYEGLMKNKPIVICGLYNKIQIFAIRFIPRFILTRITRRVHEK